MNYYACVATKDLFRLDKFMDSFCKTRYCENLYLVVVNTGDPKLPLEKILINYPRTYRFDISDKPRMYAEVIQSKLDLLRIMQSDDIIINFDDDYQMNPYWFKVLKTIYENHPEVNYLSLLREDTYKDYPSQIMSGFSISKTMTSMGGCLSARLTPFFNANRLYFEKYGINNMWDYDFCKSLNEPIYMLQDWSLVQHCNLTSSYLHTKTNKLQHMYGLNFDPSCNPFELIK